MNEKEKFYSAMATYTINQMTANRQHWTSFLTTMGRNFGFTYPEQVMIHAQRPDATLCKDYDAWREEKNRYVKRGAKGIAMFVTNRDKPYLRYVFDVSDTGARHSSRPLDELWRVEPEHREAVQTALGAAFGVAPIGSLENHLEDIANHLADEYWQSNKQAILDIVANSYLESYDVHNIEVAFRRAVGISVTYAMFTRCTDNPDLHFENEDFLNVFDFNTRQTINALGNASTALQAGCSGKWKSPFRNTTEAMRWKGAITMMNELTYTQVGEVLIPDLKLEHPTTKPLGKYGRMRRAFLEENKPLLFSDLILTEQLFPHLQEIEEAANRRVEQLMQEYLLTNPAPDKAMNQLGWVQHMNSLKAQAEEAVMTELISS